MINIPFPTFLASVLLLGALGVVACNHSADECVSADTVRQKAESPGAATAPDARPDLSGCKRTGMASSYAAKVTNLGTGQSAEVTIQDRGPNVKGRIIDLSPATAREIGLDRRDGITAVAVAPIEVPLPDGSVKQGAAADDKAM